MFKFTTVVHCSEQGSTFWREDVLNCISCNQIQQCFYLYIFSVKLSVLTEAHCNKYFLKGLWEQWKTTVCMWTCACSSICKIACVHMCVCVEGGGGGEGVRMCLCQAFHESVWQRAALAKVCRHICVHVHFYTSAWCRVYWHIYVHVCLCTHAHTDRSIKQIDI